ncbi:hypothetical protein [Pedobacter terrae]|uniref:hypothetical protein n=1 Tax=Pedobacter terrae TaxID=405671 RepID=UPI002FF65EBD
MQLKYQDGTIPQWNGNIVNQQWGAANNWANVFTYIIVTINSTVYYLPIDAGRAG